VALGAPNIHGEANIVKFVQGQVVARLGVAQTLLQSLPGDLKSSDGVKQIISTYSETQDALVAVEATESNYAQQVRDHLAGIRLTSRRGHDMQRIMEEVRTAIRRTGGGENYFGGSIQAHVDSTLQGVNHMRVSNTMLANTLDLWFEHAKQGTVPKLFIFNHRGCMHPALNVKQLVKITAANVCEVFMEETGVNPNIEMHFAGPNTIAYIPSHIQYIVQELLKNAVVAEFESHRDCSPSLGEDTGPKMAAVVLEVACDPKSLLITVSDSRGGLPNNHVWSYAYSGWNCSRSSVNVPREVRDEVVPQQWHSRVAGGGVGLAMLKMYAEMFGGKAGDLRELRDETMSTEQNGVYVRLCISPDAEEVLNSEFWPHIPMAI